MPLSLLHDLARMSAQSRLAALNHERDEILQMFPELRDGQPAARTNGSSKARERRTMSPAERKAVSGRMRAYWAERRAQKAGAKGASAKWATQKSSGKAAKRTGRMSAEARRRQAERMRAYWATRTVENSASAEGAHARPSNTGNARRKRRNK